jgi:uncharacterized protein (TIGR02391 family)
MASIHSIVPDPQALLAMEPEEAGAVVLQYLQDRDRDPTQSGPNRHNFGQVHTVCEYPQHLWPELLRVLMEGWMWLEREGFLAADPEQRGEWYLITRKGQQYTGADFTARAAAKFQQELLHPAIADRAWGEFTRGDYNTAVFKAFHDIEVEVRAAAGLASSDIGIPLMRKAFGDGGPLEDPQAERGEQQSMREFFSGAIGVFKNPQSHRHVALTEPEEAFEMLMVATHLRRIIDARRAQRQSSAP